MTIQSQQAELLQLQIAELVRVGVGGKHKNTKDYTKDLKAELELEQEMRGKGIIRYNQHKNNALIKSQESTTLYGLKYQSKYISKLSSLIYDDVNSLLKGGSGRHRISLTLICQCLNRLAFNEQLLVDKTEHWDTVSLIILKNIINGISHGHTLNKLGTQIGNALELEARLTLFEDTDKETFQKVTKILNKNVIVPQNQSRYSYKKTVFVYWMKRNKLKWKRWDKEKKLHLGSECIHYCEQLGIVKIVLVKRGKHKTVYYVNATDKILREIRDFNEMSEAMFPEHMPMIMPPMDWNYTPFRGGYYGKKYNEENKIEEVKHALSINKKQ